MFVFTAGAQIPDLLLGVPMCWLLVAVALVTSVPAIYYYTRVVILMIVPEPSERVAALAGAQQPRPWVGSPQEAPALALILCTAIVAAAGTISVDSLMGVANYTVGNLAPARRTISSAPAPVKTALNRQ